MFCKKCGTELHDGSTFCNKCGEKQVNTQQSENLNGAVSKAFFQKEEPLYKKFSFWFLIISIAIVTISFIDEGLGSSDDESYSKSNMSIEELQEFKNNCTFISYDDLARNPNRYEGNNYVFTGEIAQVEEDTDQTIYLINVTEGEYIWEDLVMCIYTASNVNSSRFLKDDIVRFYGTFEGLYTYETVLGSKNTVPYINIYDMELV